MVVIGRFVKTTRSFMHHWVKRQTTQVTQPLYSPATSGFSQTCNHLRKGRDFNQWFRKTRQDSWWQLGELLRSQGAYFEEDCETSCPIYDVSLCLLQLPSLFFIPHGWVLFWINVVCSFVYLFIYNFLTELKVYHFQRFEIAAPSFVFIYPDLLIMLFSKFIS